MKLLAFTDSLYIIGCFAGALLLLTVAFIIRAAIRRTKRFCRMAAEDTAKQEERCRIYQSHAQSDLPAGYWARPKEGSAMPPLTESERL